MGIGGIDVKNIPLEQVMRSISYVTQDNYLFDLSVRENIRMGKPDASDAEVEEAAQCVSCHEFICALPAGYHSIKITRCNVCTCPHNTCRLSYHGLCNIKYCHSKNRKRGI